MEGSMREEGKILRSVKETPSRAPRPWLLWTLVAAAIAAISCASIFIRLAAAPSMAIAAYRVGIAALALVPGVWYKRRGPAQGWNARIIARTLLAGLFLAGHFLFWIESLNHTSVASSVALVSLTPVFAGILSSVLLKERPSRKLWLGLAVSVGGSIGIAGTDYSLSVESLYGDLLALAGALMAAGYFLSGRYLRRFLGIAGYALGVYGAAAVLLLGACLATATPLTGFDPRTWLLLALLALIPQLIGHTTFNWTLRFLPATMVAVLTLGEPIGATLLAYLFLHETLTMEKSLGLAILFLGILLSSLGGSSTDR